MNTIVCVDKPAGWTSFDVVAKVRGAIRARYAAQGIKPTKRQLKVGHAGTLDPFATGLLVILLGDSCSQADTFLKLDKTYEATVRLGATSTTGDLEGDIRPVSDTQPTREAVLEALSGLIGEIEQTPPIFSAIKIDGQRAYKLARSGASVAMPTRIVTVHELDCLDYTYPDIRIRTHVSSGTYIRTLAEDIGKALGTGAYCQELRRCSVGSMTLQDSLSIDGLLSVVQSDDDRKDNADQ